MVKWKTREKIKKKQRNIEGKEKQKLHVIIKANPVQ